MKHIQVACLKKLYKPRNWPKCIKGEIDHADLLVSMDEQISRAKEEAYSRKTIMEKVEKWILACDEERWLEEYSTVCFVHWSTIIVVSIFIVILIHSCECAINEIVHVCPNQNMGFQDENRYSVTRGAHKNLRRAERARVTVNKIPGKIK